MYKLGLIDIFLNKPSCIIRLSDSCSIPFAPANTDYANFKREINESTAQLQDADGNLMTAEQAKDFVKELP